MLFFKQLIYCLLTTACFSLLAGCKGKERPVNQATANGILILGNTVEPFSLDPQKTTGVPDGRILLALFEGLVGLNPQTLEVEPAAAERWTLSEDGCTYTFFLRPTAKWSNGDPVTAQDFLFTFQRLLNPTSTAAHVKTMYSLIGAKAYHTGRTKDFATVGIKALDTHTLELKLNSPIPYFITLLAYHTFFPLHQITLETYGDHWTNPAYNVTNGPFQLTKWKVNEVIAVEANPHYWNKEAINLKGIHFLPIESRQTEERAFAAGQLHITSGVSAPSFDHYFKEHSPLLRTHPYLATAFYLINTERPPLNDWRVRKALNLSLCRQDITTHVLRRGQLPAFSLVPPAIRHYTPPSTFIENIKEAQLLLTEAGFPGGKGFPIITLSYNTSEERQLLAQTVQGMWKEHLGINVILENQEWKSFLAKRSQGNFDLCRGDWVGDYNDPTTFLDLFRSDSAFNTTSWKDAHYDNLLNQALLIKDMNERMQKLQEAEAYLLEDAPIIPLFFLNWSALVHPNVQGWHDNVLDYHPYQEVLLKAVP